MPPREVPFVVQEKSWTELLNHARLWRNISRKHMNTTLHHFSVFCDENGTERLLALGGTGPSPRQTLYTAPLTRSELITNLSHLTLTPFIGATTSGNSSPSPELAALCERQRSSLLSGITSYQYDATSSALLYSDFSDLYVVKGEKKRKIGGDVGACSIDAEVCPVDSKLIAFVAKSNVHIDLNGDLIYSTTSVEHVRNGCSSFVSQEEFDRFVGIWWSPGPRKMLLYERVDETSVVSLQFICPGYSPNNLMKYPLAGTSNAISTLCLLSIGDDSTVVDNDLEVDLKSLYPWYEYLSRVGWLPNGNAIWAIIFNRLQDRYALILIPVNLFGKQTDCCSEQIVTLMERQTEVWFNVDNLTQFLSSKANELIFIHANDRNDHTHLFLYKTKIEAGRNITICSEKEITSGDWSVMKCSGVHVDEKRSQVYFVANKHHPTDSNLCVASYESLTETRILSDIGLSFRSERMEYELRLNENIGFLCWESSLRVPPRCIFYRIHHRKDDPLPIAVLQHIIHLPQPDIIGEQQLSQNINFEATESPEIVDFVSQNSQRKHYAFLLKPFGALKGVRYPVIQVVYGGPGVQLVRNSWATWAGFRKFASMGYAVLMVDGRGSSNRGLSFEAPIKGHLGTVEVEDQVEGLREVAKRTDGLLDLNRVIVMGWSYGGYLSLLCIAKFPKIFRAAIAGGAVTCWRRYDTAYTERYLGLPSDPVYKNASVLSYVNQLPDELDRLLIVHGLIDENVHFSHTERLIDAMIAAGKPYRLHIFPSERHGVRSVDANEFHDASILSFIARALCSPSMQSLNNNTPLGN